MSLPHTDRCGPELFERLRQGFNQGNYEDRREVFVECVREAVERRGPSPTVLDIGCGYGIRRERDPQRRIAAAAGRLWGLDPDPEVEIDRELFREFWRSTLENAPIPAESVDVAYAHMVVEHVADTPRFAHKLHHVLKPGGCAILLTINARSYLGRAARIARRIRAQDSILRALRGGSVVEGYHYPALYRFNDERVVTRVALAAGVREGGVRLSRSRRGQGLFPRSASLHPAVHRVQAPHPGTARLPDESPDRAPQGSARAEPRPGDSTPRPGIVTRPCSGRGRHGFSSRSRHFSQVAEVVATGPRPLKGDKNLLHCAVVMLDTLRSLYPTWSDLKCSSATAFGGCSVSFLA